MNSISKCVLILRKIPPDNPILIDRDVERVLSGPEALNIFFTKLDESVWSFGGNLLNQRGFEGNQPNDSGIRLHEDLASNEIIKIVCGSGNTLILTAGWSRYMLAWLKIE